MKPPIYLPEWLYHFISPPTVYDSPLPSLGHEQCLGCKERSWVFQEGKYLEGFSNTLSLLQTGRLIEKRVVESKMSLGEEAAECSPSTAWWVGLLNAPLC